MHRNTPSPTLHHSSPLDALVRRASSRRYRQNDGAALAVPSASTPPRTQQWRPPSSPLLHTQFRTSTATQSSYNDANSTFRTDGARSTGTWDGAPPSPLHGQAQSRIHSVASSVSLYDTDDASTYRDTWASANVPPTAPAVPTVVVSEDPAPPNTSRSSGKVPSRLPTGANFSRPGLPPVDDSDAHKQQVLLRNARSDASLYNNATTSGTRTPSPIPPAQSNSNRSLAATHPPQPDAQRPGSSNSLYSAYSYYNLDSAAPSPTDPAWPTASPSPSTPGPAGPAPAIKVTPATPAQKALASTDAAPSTPTTAQDFLQLGIQHHLANRLPESAECFEKSATLNGGCGVGMLMWGLALRHGWGCAKSEVRGFRWLRKAAEAAVEDLESARGGIDSSAVKSELVLAIYEVGQSFFRGWGIEKDKKMAVSYFTVAAKLGDPDAQQELAFCLANGKGCKKDRKEAAKWYRAAVAQGASDIGLAWIYKEKFK